MPINTDNYQLEFDTFYRKIISIPDRLTTIRQQTEHWTLKEMLGHLIDSAANNHQRFVRLQLEKKMNFPKYEPEAWIKVQAVNALPWNKLVELWKLYNELLLHLIKNINQECLKNVWLVDNQEKTLELLINDYYRHLEWHRNLLTERAKELESVT